MSDEVVRDSARALMADASWPAGLPYHDTLGTAPDPAGLPDTWCTLFFDTESDEQVGIGTMGMREERGRITLAILADLDPAVGDADAVALAGAAKVALRGWAWPAGLRIESLDGPDHPDPAGIGTYLQTDVGVQYVLQYAS